ncbi:MAG: hypothetical protein RI990_1618 [Planctomycetota bacterium]
MEAITDMGVPEDPPLARSIGAFFGHIIDAVRTDPNAPAAAEVRRETTEERRPDGVTLRRTVIEEVVLPPGTPPPDTTGPGTAGPTDA